MIPPHGNTASLQPDELNAVYAISRVVAEKVEIDDALAEIVRLARPVFIFDNAVLYLQDSVDGPLEPAFARAIGRGKTSKADISWGGQAAQKAFSSGKMHISKTQASKDTDRLDQSFFLALPMLVGGNLIGALVFIRFGGPAFTEDQVNLAEFIASHVTQVLEHQRLLERVGHLEADRQLEQLQSNFLALVSHELKTPLGFIKGYSSSLLRENANWSEGQQLEFLQIIDEEADRMSELVDNLLDSSRMLSGKLPMGITRINLNLLIEEVVERLRISLPEMQIKVEVPLNDIYIHADPKRVSQVFENLVNNAFKYAPGSSVLVSLQEEAEIARIEVRDSGPGIPADHLDKIFKRFYRVPDENKSVRGSGLGLYISKQIVESHSGRLLVSSELRKGTTFTVELPKENIAEAVKAI